MNDDITPNTLAWARQHDWGLDARISARGKLNGCIERATRSIATDAEPLATELYEREVSFTSRRELRAWAGY